MRAKRSSSKGEWIYGQSINSFDIEDLRAPQDCKSSSKQTQAIRVSGERWVSLSPLADFSELQILLCENIQANDLSPLADLPKLKVLHYKSSSPTRLSGQIPSLIVFDAAGTPVDSLDFLVDSHGLRLLNCTNTRITNLQALKELREIEEIYISDTKVSDLGPIKNAQKLKKIFLARTLVSDLGPLEELRSLEYISASQLRLSGLHTRLWKKKNLKHVTLLNTFLPTLPEGVSLSSRPGENCVRALRAHCADLVEGAEPVRDLKMMILGNGRVGKTQIRNRLLGEEFNEVEQSTHGIHIGKFELTLDDGTIADLKVWDFGGQDIYLGTHAVFLRSRSLFPIVWSEDMERSAQHEYQGLKFQNQPLGYWVRFVEQMAGPENPVLLIQNKCDDASDEVLDLSVDLEALTSFRFRRTHIHYSAKYKRGHETLLGALRDAAAWVLHERGNVLVGRGRLDVKKKVEQLFFEDQMRPPDERTHRTLTLDQFVEICREAKGVSDSSALLSYLHNTGVLFYREGLFNNSIIIDQQWALEAVYAIFERDRVYRFLRRQKGRFKKSDIADWLWSEMGHGMAEQDLFISMMLSCGICFCWRGSAERTVKIFEDGKEVERNVVIEAEYIAPDFLPSVSEAEDLRDELSDRWDPTLPVLKVDFEYSLLPPGFLRQLMSRIGGRAGLRAIYWQEGFHIFEVATGARGRVTEVAEPGSWSGKIRIATQKGADSFLLEFLVDLVEKENALWHLRPTKQDSAPVGAIPARERLRLDGQHDQRPVFAQERHNLKEVYISYAWGDDSDSGRIREEALRQICAALEERGCEIIYDKNRMGYGERISKFMDRLAAADRLVVILSDKYLKSVYCMYELYEAWRRCGRNESYFLDRIRIVRLPDAEIDTIAQRIEYARYWRDEYCELQEIIARDLELVSDADFQAFRLVSDFARHTSSILSLVADTMHKRYVEDIGNIEVESILK